MTAPAGLVADTVSRHYGLTVLELGEDGGTLVVLGHHSDRRTLAALNHYARTVWGASSVAGDFGDGAQVLADLKRVRAIVTHSCDRGWGAEDELPTAELEVIDPAAPTCPDCADRDATWAMLWRPDAQDHPASFPVTVLELDQ